MEQILDNLRMMDKSIFFSLYDFSNNNPRWQELFQWFAEYGIVLIIIGVIYLVVKSRINALFTAMVSALLGSIIGTLVYLIWQRPRPFITFAAEIVPIAAHVTSNSFPSAHTYLSFAISVAVILRGHKKLGLAMFLVSIAIAVSRIASGLHYPSDIIGGISIGLVAGILAFWFVENFEDFWLKNSAE